MFIITRQIYDILVEFRVHVSKCVYCKASLWVDDHHETSRASSGSDSFLQFYLLYTYRFDWQLISCVSLAGMAECLPKITMNHFEVPLGARMRMRP